MNTQTKLVTLAHIGLGGGGLFVALATYLWMALTDDGYNPALVAHIERTILIITGAVLLPWLIAGIGLLYQQRWARVWLIVWSFLLLPVVPVGTLLGGWALWVLLKKRVPGTQPL
jgi:hypothetical protein